MSHDSTASRHADTIAVVAALDAMQRLPLYRNRWPDLAAAARIIAEQQQQLANLRHACLAAIGYVAGQSIIADKDAMHRVLADAVRDVEYVPPPPKAFGRVSTSMSG